MKDQRKVHRMSTLKGQRIHCVSLCHDFLICFVIVLKSGALWQNWSCWRSILCRTTVGFLARSDKFRNICVRRKRHWHLQLASSPSGDFLHPENAGHPEWKLWDWKQVLPPVHWVRDPTKLFRFCIYRSIYKTETKQVPMNILYLYKCCYQLCFESLQTTAFDNHWYGGVQVLPRSMVGDVHRTLLYGGLFAYPADTKNKDRLGRSQRTLYQRSQKRLGGRKPEKTADAFNLERTAYSQKA